MIKAQQQGRRLVLSIETGEGEAPVEPFLVDPLPMSVGREISTRYVFATEGIPVSDGSVGQDLLLAFGAANMERASNTLRADEFELVSQCAYFWQTVGGMEMVRAMLTPDEDGVQGGDVGRGKAMAAFQLRMVPLLSQIRRHLESARRTLTASTPDTDTRSGSESSESEPASPPKPSEQQPNPTTPASESGPSPETSGSS